MPRRNSLIRRLPLLGRGWDEWDRTPLPQPKPQPKPEPTAAKAASRGGSRRFATSFSFCILFFAGLALSAGAGNQVRSLLDDNESTVAQDVTASTTADASLTKSLLTAQQHAVVHATRVERRIASAAGGSQVSARRSPVREVAPAPARARATQRRVASSTGVRRAAGKQAQASKTKRSRPAHTQPLDTEGTLPGATVWLYQAAPDPTPPAMRLRLGFARDLVAYSRSAGVDWALVLAVLRADGHNGRVPATVSQLRTLSLRLRRLGGGGNGWAAALAYSRQTAFADRVVALRHYYRAVGMASLVHGLLSQKRDLEDRVLHDPQLLIYPGGRNDVASHKVDVRVLAVMLYLADTFHQVTVSCLISGHRLYARPGVVSAHIYGRAVDIAALGDVSIYGHQQPGGITEQGVRALLLLPPEMLPAQIISLLGLGGPSFPLANHYDHIHVGY